MAQKNYNWDTVTEYLQENTQAGTMMATLEADKILMSVIDDLDYPGSNYRERLNAAKKLFSDFTRVKKAHSFNQKIRREVDFTITPKLAEEILAVYYQALSDIKENKKPQFSLAQKIIFFGLKIKNKGKKILKWFVISLVVFFLMIFLLDKTKLGQDTVQFILRIEELIFSWLLVLILLGVGAAALIIASIWYFKSRQKINFNTNVK